MTIPGFVAEVAIYRSHVHYQVAHATHVVQEKKQHAGELNMAMINLGDGIDCANCVGGECAELRCFEN